MKSSIVLEKTLSANMLFMETDELQEYLNALGRSDNYRVDAVLSDAPHERTERVVRKATELAPEKRFQSVEALKAAFLGALASARPAEQPPSIAPKPAVQEKLTKPKGFFSRIPLGVGVAWDVILLLVWLLFFAASNAVIVSPTGEVAQHPLWFLIVEYYGVIVLPITVLVYYLLDLRPLRKLFPKAKFLPRRKTWPFAILAVFVLIIATIAIGTLSGIFSA